MRCPGTTGNILKGAKDSRLPEATTGVLAASDVGENWEEVSKEGERQQTPKRESKTWEVVADSLEHGVCGVAWLPLSFLTYNEDYGTRWAIIRKQLKGARGGSGVTL